MMNVFLSQWRFYLVLLTGFSIVALIRWQMGIAGAVESVLFGVGLCALFLGADLVLSKYKKRGLDVLLYILIFVASTAYWLRPQ